MIEERESWFKIYRKIFTHWLFKDHKKKSPFEAWLLMIASANYEDSKEIIKGQVVECKRGQCIYSLQTWAEKFGWSLQVTRTFLKNLENDKMIVKEGLKYTTRITICNYDTYQANKQTNNILLTDSQHSANILLTTSKEYKELKKERIDISDDIPKTKSRNILFKTYLKDYDLDKKSFIDNFKSSDSKNEFPDQELNQKAFDTMLDWSSGNNKRKIDWVSTYRNWLRRDYQKRSTSGNGKNFNFKYDTYE